MRGIADGLVAFYVVSLVIAAILGWCFIEGLVWLFSHISISWVW